MLDYHLFKPRHLNILKNINTFYKKQLNPSTFSGNYTVHNYGVELSSSTPNDGKSSTNVVMYAGSELFNALYCAQPDHGYREYGWRTGWNSGELSTNSCSLIFGLIPISWGSGHCHTATDQGRDTTTLWKGGNSDPAGTLAFTDFFPAIGYPNLFRTQYSTFSTYRSFNGGDPMQWAALSDVKIPRLVNDRGMYCMFLGSNPNIYNNYTGVEFLYGFDYFYKDSSSTKVFELYEEFKNIMSNEENDYFRPGIVIGKTLKNDQLYVEPISAVGYVAAGTPTTHSHNKLKLYSRNNNGSVSTVTAGYYDDIQRAMGGSSRYSLDFCFGEMPFYHYDGTEIFGTFGSILNSIYENLPAYYQNAVDAGVECPLPCKPVDGNSYKMPVVNLFDYSTVKYAVQYSIGQGGPLRLIDFVPVFAQSLSNNNIGNYSNYCCIIQTFQSLIFNTYYQDAYLNRYSGLPGGGGAGYHVWAEDDNEADGNATWANITPAKFKTFNQIKNTYDNYNNFNMKYIPPASNNPQDGKIYISFAIKVGCDSNTGLPTKFIPGQAFAGYTDWIAWINGNIYVIPQVCFNKFVYWSCDDFDFLDTIPPELLGFRDNYYVG